MPCHCVVFENWIKWNSIWPMRAPNRCLWTTELDKQTNKQWQLLQHTKAYRLKQPNSNIPYKMYEIKVNGHHQIVSSSILLGFQRAKTFSMHLRCYERYVNPIRIWYRVEFLFTFFLCVCVCYVRASLCGARSLLNFVIGEGKEMREREREREAKQQQESKHYVRTYI